MTPQDATPASLVHQDWTFVQTPEGDIRPPTTPQVAWLLEQARLQGRAYWHYLGEVPIPSAGAWTIRQLAAVLGPYMSLPDAWIEALSLSQDQGDGEEPLY